MKKINQVGHRFNHVFGKDWRILSVQPHYAHAQWRRGQGMNCQACKYLSSVCFATSRLKSVLCIRINFPPTTSHWSHDCVHKPRSINLHAPQIRRSQPSCVVISVHQAHRTTGGDKGVTRVDCNFRAYLIKYNHVNKSHTHTLFHCNIFWTSKKLECQIFHNALL